VHLLQKNQPSSDKKFVAIKLKYFAYCAGVAFALLVLIGLTGWGVYISQQHRINYYFGDAFLQSISKVALKAEINYGFPTADEIIKHVGSPPLPRLYLNIKFKHAKKITNERNQALFAGGIARSLVNEYPARITYEGSERGARVRLKGKYVDHIDSNKWSLRVKLRKDARIMGMRAFSLQSPAVRKYLYEYVFLENLRNENVLALRYDFVELYINQAYKGVYAIEEFYAKELIESSRRREGPIFRLENGQPEFYGLQKLINNPMLNSQRIIATQLAEKINPNSASFLDVDPEEIFDVELMAKHFAIAHVWHADHALIPNNFRFYYNPITRKLELIGYDGSVEAIESNIPRPNYLVRLLMRSDNFRKAFVRELFRVSSQNYFDDNLMPLIRLSQSKYHQILRNEPFASKVSVEFILENQGKIRESLQSFAELELLEEKEGELFLRSNSRFSIRLNGLLQKDGEDVVNRYELLEHKNSTIIPQSMTKLDMGNLRLRDNGLDLYLSYSLEGLSGDLEHYIKVPSRHQAFFLSSNERQKESNLLDETRLIDPTLSLPDEWIVDEGSRSVTVPSGLYRLQDPIEMPRNYRLIIQSNTEFVLGENFYLEVNGPVSIGMLGPDRGKVLFRPQEDTWKGMIIYQQSEVSTIQNVSFSGIKGIDIPGANITGGVTVFGGELLLSKTDIGNVLTEDALNVVDAKISMDEVQIYDVVSDAIDLDFCEGKLENITFDSILGDGLDISGSRVTLKHLNSNNVFDKAVSVGERSRFSGQNLEISNCSMGIVSKDDSTVDVSGVKINDCRHGLVAYQKKPEYGPSEVRGLDISMANVERECFIQSNSKGFLNGTNCVPTTINIDELYEKE
jgi:hypothetical protein